MRLSLTAVLLTLLVLGLGTSTVCSVPVIPRVRALLVTVALWGTLCALAMELKWMANPAVALSVGSVCIALCWTLWMVSLRRVNLSLVPMYAQCWLCSLALRCFEGVRCGFGAQSALCAVCVWGGGGGQS